MASRIQDSASGLLQNTFSAPSSRSAAHDIASTLAAGLGSSGKGSSSSHAPLQSGSATPGSISQSHGLGLGQPSSRAGEARRFPSESFRSAPSSAASNLYDEDDYRAWERFQDPPQNDIINDNNDRDDALLLDPYDVSSGKGKGKLRTEGPVDLLDPSTTITTTTSSSASLEKHLPDDTFDFAWHNSSATTATTTRNHNHSQIQRNNPTHDISHHTPYTPHPTDGQAVVALLSSPTFQPATFTPPESPQSELFELDASMLQPLPTSSPNPLRTTTTTTTTTQTPSFPPNQLSLIPDINSILTAIQQQQQQQQQSHPHGQHDQDWEWDWREMPGVAEWLEVDGTYQDTVWGFLKPYVEAARKEIIERGEDGGGGDGPVEDGPAVKRLGMVMRHLRARL
ncbi:hypothetical protein EMPG_13142 [Blastomyces silverae]|uniref:Uncharacterized protein n=1 Tax=Blastomyces silverae TaxID=2060906 RepID=A0A0H1BKX0_9EURO|nr:hypothetical protein EMPG_13142 [Blastomyces silverae]